MLSVLSQIPAEYALFFELSIVITIGVIVAIIMRLLRQPLIISHIVTGLIVGPFVFNFIHSFEIFNLFSELGIAILLFTVGLNLTPRVIKEFGKISLVTGIGQVIVTSMVGFLICLAFGWSPIVAMYVGFALAFSSTIIILKLLSDKGELESLHGKISIGFLLVQDIIALILLFTIPIVSSPDSTWLSIVIMFAKGIILSLFVWLVAHKVLKPLNSFLSSSQELLFLFSISWGFLIAAIFKFAGFSLETGALIAGVSLAAMPSRHEISARLVTMRDFFIVVFFILLGAQMVLTGIWDIVPMAIVLSLFVMIGNPIILMIIMGMHGYRKRTAFKTGLTVAQISEFSLILVALGLKLGHLDSRILSAVTLIGLITIFCSTYMVMYSDKLYTFLEPLLNIFEKKKPNEKRYVKKRYPIILFGCNRIGHDFAETFAAGKKKFLVVDYNPEMVKELSNLKVTTEYGDAGDINMLETFDFSVLELAVSTIPHFETNQLIVEEIRKHNKKASLMIVAHSIKDALNLYKMDVDYVILPHFLGGRYAVDMLSKIGSKRSKFTALKKKHLRYLEQRLELGHEHPLFQ
jgi:Kef-type K+ transport system membrane component KefB